MTEKILFVDDEINILESITRQLRKRFTLKTSLAMALAPAKSGPGSPPSAAVVDREGSLSGYGQDDAYRQC